MEVVVLADWQNGMFLGADDQALLLAGRESGWVLVTYDQRTILPLLKVWGESAVRHGGLVFVDEKTLRPDDIGGLLHALCFLWDRERSAEWTDRVVYLRPAAATR